MDENIRRRYGLLNDSGTDPVQRNANENQEHPNYTNINIFSTSGNRQDRQPSKPRAAVAYVMIGSFYLLLSIFVHRRMNSYPAPKTLENSRPNEFREENARKHLEIITALGPRVSGSDANDKAMDYILNTVSSIIDDKTNNISIEIDLQVASGSFTLDFVNNGVGYFSSVYQDLKNVVVKVSPQPEAESSVLINCHYDTVVDSPGAGDDAVSCCVMLEMLRALSQTDQSDLHIMHNVIFLFNSAEENILQTSHAFITQHQWAPSVKAFINLDSAGAGGWETVFQTDVTCGMLAGPEHPWLIKAYIEAAPYPHASVIGQEIFQTGMIPSDTDFRIFRDYGAIPGIDIAHIKNGYVYHTMNDIPFFIPAGCMQRGGENILATIKNMASSSKLTDPGEDKHGTQVYFDFLGYFVVSYPHRIAVILNWSTVIYVIVTYFKTIFQDRNEVSTKLKQLSLATVVMLSTWVVILVVPLLIACFLSAIGHSLSYYTHNLNVIWLFMLPSVTAAMVFHLVLKRTVYKNTDAEAVVALLQDVNIIIWSLILAAMTAKGLMSSFLPLMLVMSPVCIYSVLKILGYKTTTVAFSLLATIVPNFYIVGMAYTLLFFLIPIMGRSGLETNPDVLISVVSAFPVVICLPQQIGFVYTHSRVTQVISTTLVVICLGIVSVIMTPAGFPYSANRMDASIKRALMVHFDRNFHSFAGDVFQKDAYVWFQPIDYLGGNVLAQHNSWILERAQQASCDGVYCGRPYLHPILPHLDARKTFDFPASPLNLTRVNVQLLERAFLSDSDIRLNFSMSGPSHVTIFIAELQKSKIKHWDFSHYIPVEAVTLPHMKHTTYFVYYSHAGPPNTTWNFSMVVHLDNSETINHPLIRIGFAGHYLHGPNQLTPDLLLIDKELPPWMMAMRWTATYDEFIF